MAAYYLRAANASYAEYLENIKSHRENFEKFQTSILNDNGNYNKTRYGIITLSLKETSKKSKDFSSLFLLISMINSQNIPKSLLEMHKDNIVVDDFIYHLKKYSLIFSDSFCPSKSFSSLSLHHSVQDISFSYLVQKLALNKGSPLLDSISNILDDYMEKVIEHEEFLKIKMMGNHLEKFLEHSDLLTDLSKGFLKSKLASIYYLINNDKAHKTVGESYEILKMQDINRLSSSDVSRLARSFLLIGAIYTKLSCYKEAEQVLKKVSDIYGEKGLKNYVEWSWSLSHLGNLYRRIGNYEKARNYLEESIRLSKIYGGNTPRTARTLAYLGNIYARIGLYQKSIDLLKESLALYKEHFSDSHFRVGWILMRLGDTYRRLGNYDKSIHYLQQSLQIHQKHFDEDHIRIGWILFLLASTYKSMGNYEDAAKLFDRILKIYDKYCWEESIEAARLLREMAKIYFQKNDLEDAERFAKRSLKILQNYRHVDAYKALEVLGEIYLKKSDKFLQTMNVQEEKLFKNKTIEKFVQALKIVEHNFPENSVHIERIYFKIKKIKEKNIAPHPEKPNSF